MTAAEMPKVESVITPEDIIAAQKSVREIYVDQKIKDYVPRYCICNKGS